METISFRINGTGTLLMNNPQTVDPFNGYAQKIKPLRSKRGKTDEQLLTLRTLEIESKLYMNDELGIYVPTSWVMSAVAQTSFKKAKIAKKDIRAGVFCDESKAKLNFRGSKKIKTKRDISGNPEFYVTMLIKQGQVKVPKSTPEFDEWSFQTSLTFDPKVIDKRTLVDILTYCCEYGGFGDFRPTFGRASLEMLN